MGEAQKDTSHRSGPLWSTGTVAPRAGLLLHKPGLLLEDVDHAVVGGVPGLQGSGSNPHREQGLCSMIASFTALFGVKTPTMAD